MAFVLATAIGVQMYNVRARKGSERQLRDWIPDALPRWQAREEMLGSTEAVSSRIAQGLKFDDYVYLSFNRGDVWFSIYVAYWSSGRPARGLVGEHTPDTCWPLNGCVPLDRRSEFALYGDERVLPRCEWRRFRMGDGRNTEVVFWHVVGGKVLHFDNHSPLRWVRDAARELSVARREQYFVRITTQDGGFERLREDSEFRMLLQNVGRLVLRGG